MICVHVNLHGLFFMKAYFNKELKKNLGKEVSTSRPLVQSCREVNYFTEYMLIFAYRDLTEAPTTSFATDASSPRSATSRGLSDRAACMALLTRFEAF